MDIFNYIVGGFTIASAIATIVSVVLLKQISKTVNVSGKNATNTQQKNKGDHSSNKAIIITGDRNCETDK